MLYDDGIVTQHAAAIDEQAAPILDASIDDHGSETIGRDRSLPSPLTEHGVADEEPRSAQAQICAETNANLQAEAQVSTTVNVTNHTRGTNSSPIPLLNERDMQQISKHADKPDVEIVDLTAELQSTITATRDSTLQHAREPSVSDERPLAAHITYSRTPATNNPPLLEEPAVYQTLIPGASPARYRQYTSNSTIDHSRADARYTARSTSASSTGSTFVTPPAPTVLSVPALCQLYQTRLNNEIAFWNNQKLDISKWPAITLRTHWLTKLCHNQDLALLYLQQLQTVYAVNREKAIYAMLLDHPMQASLDLLNTVLANVNDPRPKIMKFFSEFPFPIQDGQIFVPAAQQASMVWILSFLQKFSLSWHKMTAGAVRRHCPLMPSEIIEQLGINRSDGLVMMLFRNSVFQFSRNPGPALMHNVSEAFALDMSAYWTRRAQGINLPFHEAVGIWEKKWYKIRAQEAPTSMDNTISPSAAIPSQSHVCFLAQQNAVPSPGANVRLQSRPQAVLRVPVQSRVYQYSHTNLPITGAHTYTAAGQITRTRPQDVSGLPTSRSNEISKTNFIFYNPPMNSTGPINDPTVGEISHPLLPSTRNMPGMRADPNPRVHALHQAHLRAPQPVAAPNVRRLYQSHSGFLLQPFMWSRKEILIKKAFVVPSDSFCRRAVSMEARPMSHGTLLDEPKRYLDSGKLIFILRCVKIPHHLEQVDQSTWHSSTTCWPAHIFINLNGNFLEIRRKRGWKRDLHIDVTEYVAEGNNGLTISIHPTQDDTNKYGIAVESVSFSTHTEVLAMIQQPDEEIPKDHSLASILKTMNGSEDDEVQVTTTSLTIEMTDPFSGRLFSIPVRGAQCKHREVLDLENWLNSRLSESDDDVAVTNLDGWLCPHSGCLSDARPQNLVVDGWLSEVRKTIAEQGLEDGARAIVVQQDGTWAVRKEEENSKANNTKTSIADREMSKSRSASVQADMPVKDELAISVITSRNAHDVGDQVMEIIELDD